MQKKNRGAIRTKARSNVVLESYCPPVCNGSKLQSLPWSSRVYEVVLGVVQGSGVRARR